MPTLASSTCRPAAHAWIRACLFTLTPLLGLATGCAPRPPAQVPPPAAATPPEPAGPLRLEAEKATSGIARPGSPAHYRIEAETGGLLELEIDAASPATLRVLSPGGAEAGRVEVRAGGWQPERLLLITTGEGWQTVEVSAPASSPEVPFRLTARAPRPVATGDAERVEGEKARAEGERLGAKEDIASLRQALERLEVSRSHFEKAGDLQGQARALDALAAVQLRLGSPAEATLRAQEALALLARPGGPAGNAVEARARALLGGAALAGGSNAEARPQLERAATLWRALRGAGASPTSAAGLGGVLLDLGLLETGSDRERAWSLLTEAAPLLRQGGDGENEIRALAALQLVFAALGRPEEGEKSLLEALRRSRAEGFRRPESEIQARLAALRRQAGDLRGAQTSYRRTFELERDLGRTRSAALALFDLCAVQRDLGDDEAARACYAQAGEESRRLGAKELEALSLAEQAEVALRQNRPRDALTVLDRLAPVLRTLPPEESRALQVRAALDSGIAKRLSGRSKEALADLQAALDLLATRGSGAETAQTAQALLQLAVTRQRLGDLDGAESTFRQAGELADRSGLPGEKRRSLFGLAILAFSRRNLPEARVRIEEVLALDPKTGDLAPWERTLDPTDAGRHAFYELEVELLMRLHFEEPGAGYAEIAFRTALASRDLGGVGRPESLGERAGQLTETQALLHYFVGQERSYLFVVTRLGLKTFEVPIRARELAAKIQRLRSTLSQKQAATRPFLMDAVPLYEVLLGPAESFLAGKRHLIVSAEGPLLTLPFEALPTDAKASRGSTFAEIPYLLLDRTVSYRPYRPASGPPPAPAPSPEAGPALTFVAFAAPLPKGLEPPPARYREEVEEIAGRYPKEAVEVFLGSEATEPKAAANPRLAGARRLHFAAPALYDSTQPERSALALTPAGPGDDGTLEAAEIAALRLNAETVALPFCRTVRGREVGGEGGVALASAFRRAGARSVLLGLWTTPEAAASNLLPRFYERLDAGEPAAEALRSAKLSLLLGGAADPAGWAPYLLLE